ncbi:NAD(P)-binding domain-containing protein [Ramlibacter sp. WS9]|uniref:NAD(P)-binding domain-containing protein n=1 Tax=Ramlibacter sp. WS9 TaxID=1882741 RepID=UPI0011435BE0|nr:NAD(P)/FAD-dependent oxidoreductase [Ramlibacter sp. WS9]ROZ78785.1 NAD(P)/FAD-dependent oxidoreductase [Ramlibacter sp. WS9]
MPSSPHTGPTGLTGLTALEERLAEDLVCLGLPPRAWMQAREHEGSSVLDVAIVGGGQAGLSAAVGLAHQGIKAVVLDRAPEGFEGPWATTARMETLRSPKELTGPAMGLPALTFRAWFVAQFGHAAWAALDKIPRLQWMDYLRWYRRVMRVDVRNDTAVTGIVPRADGLVHLDLQTPAGSSVLLARRVVLATGRDGLGGPAVPGFVSALPRTLWAHSSDAMDYGTLAGKRVAVIGAGSSAMDSAATALEAGAHSVHLLIRRKDLPRINKGKGASVAGLTQGHHDLPDADKWRLRHFINASQVPPPRGSTLRVSRHPNAHFQLDCPVLDVQRHDDGLLVRTPKGEFEFDFLIASTGFRTDWSSRPEYATIAPHIRVWADRFQPPRGHEDPELADSPDLGPCFEFREKTPGNCRGLSRVHCFCYPATLSHGAVSGDIPNISDGARRLAAGIASHFYCEDFEQHLANLEAYDEPELLGDEWVPAESLPNNHYPMKATLS